MVVICPGVCGHSRDKYVYWACKTAWLKLGMRTCVLNKRGYMLPFKGHKFMQWTTYQDMHEVLCFLKGIKGDEELSEKSKDGYNYQANKPLDFQATRIHVISFSMGACFALKYLGVYSSLNQEPEPAEQKQDEETRIKLSLPKDASLVKHKGHMIDSLVTVSNPWCLQKCNLVVDSNLLLRKGILKNLKDNIRNHYNNKAFQQVCKEQNIDLDKVLSCVKRQDQQQDTEKKIEHSAYFICSSRSRAPCPPDASSFFSAPWPPAA